MIKKILKVLLVAYTHVFAASLSEEDMVNTPAANFNKLTNAESNFSPTDQLPRNRIAFFYIDNNLGRFDEDDEVITPIHYECGGKCDSTIGFFGPWVDRYTGVAVFSFIIYAEQVLSKNVKDWVEQVESRLPKSHSSKFVPNELFFAYQFTYRFKDSYSGYVTCPNLIIARGKNSEGVNDYLFSNYVNGAAVTNKNRSYNVDIACYTLDNKLRVYHASGGYFQEEDIRINYY